MAALDFPAAPDVDDEYTANGRTWKWNGETWRALPLVGATGTSLLNFPASPSLDDLHTHDGWQWQWNGETWRSYGAFATLPAEPWGEVTRQDTLSAGKLILSGLSLSHLMAARLHISGVTVTTDDSQVFLRLHISGSVVSSSTYRWGYMRLGSGDLTPVGSAGTATEIPVSSSATRGVGNASGESLAADVLIFGPAAANWKYLSIHSHWVKPAATGHTLNGAAHLEDTGPITGFEVYGSSDLTAGTLTLTGLR